MQKRYNQAQAYYQSDSYPEAEEIFVILGNYGRSKDYLLLITAKDTANVQYYNELLERICFEDAKQILIKYSTYFDKFIIGERKSADKKYCLKAECRYGLYSFSYNIPAEYVNGEYSSLKDGMYFEGGKQLFKFLSLIRILFLYIPTKVVKVTS